MPVTPFHFGIGLLGKGAAPRRISLLAFVASQIVIDCESAYYLFVAREWPVHRGFHTLAIAVPLGAAVGLAVSVASRVLGSGNGAYPSETRMAPCLAGGLLGGLTHPLLDAVMHSDVQPFLPLSAGNPLLGIVSLTSLHMGCLGAAVLGSLLLLVTARRAGMRRSRTMRC